MSDEKIPTAFGKVTPVETSLLPKGWATAILDNFLEQQDRMIRHWDISAGIDPDNRPTTGEERPLPDQFLADRADFARRWNALVTEGETSGYLDREHCYECAGELKVSEKTTEWETVPNPNYDPDKPDPYRKETR